MGNFSRDTFDRLKHYVGVRLQQGVPLIDADWNELDDIRRFELQAFVKWFVGDGVPDGNDGFRAAPLANGGLGTLVLTSRRATPGTSSVQVSPASTAAAVLGFGAANNAARRTGSSPASLTGDQAGPFALAAGMTLVLSADGQPAETVTFQPASFANIGAASAAEVAAAINAAASRTSAAAGAGNDFTITGGDGTPEGAGRCLVDGRDALNERRLTYTAQPLYNNAELAAAWGVAPLPPLAQPPPAGTPRTDTVYLDLWEREVSAREDSALINPLIGVESCIRIRREWAVRVRPGADAPARGDADYLAGHSYLALATLTRRPGLSRIDPADIVDLRPRGLAVPPSTLVEDLFGVGLAAYRRGQGRPAISLRAAINALIRGELPGTSDTPVSPAPTLDFMSYAFHAVDNDIVALWHSRRAANVNQVFATRWPQADIAAAVGAPASQITSGAATHAMPGSVALPNGELVVAYETIQAPQQDIHLRRGTLAGLATAPEVVVATTAGLAERQPFAVLAGDTVLLFWHQGQGTPTRSWQYRRWRHSDSTFIDAAPQQLSPLNTIASTLSGGLGDFHAAVTAGGELWAAFRAEEAGGATIHLVRRNLASATAEEQTISTGNANEQPFVVVEGNVAVWVFWRSGPDATASIVYRRIPQPPPADWTTLPLQTAVSGGSNGRACAVQTSDSGLWLFWSRQKPTVTNRAIWSARYNATSDGWGDQRQVVGSNASDDQPYAIAGPNGAVWLFWVSSRSGNLDLYTKQFVTAV